MKYHSSYYDFLDAPEHDPLTAEEVYGSSLRLTEDPYPFDLTFPLELANQIITKVCINPSNPIPLGAMYQALLIEAEETLFERVLPNEQFLFILERYLRQVYARQKDAVRLKQCSREHTPAAHK